MSKGNRVLFVINKYSGTGYSRALEGRILSQCKKRNLECTIEFTKHPGHATALAKMAVDKKFKMVFAVGGDGTVNEVAKGLLYSTVPLAIIPKGSGNGLARHLKIPLGMNKALKLLDVEKTISIDTFTINDRLSVNVSGIGFDGHVAGLFARDGKRGLYTYGKLVVGEFNKFKAFDCELSLDGVISKRSPFVISFANSSQFGNNAVIAPGASVCDHKIDVCIVDKMNVYQGLGFVYKLFSRSIDKSNKVQLIKAQEIKIKSSHTIPFHIDGEAADAASEFIIKINPSSLWVVLPKNSTSV